MAKHVENPGQDSLGVLPITVRRNAYGRQNESFITRYDLRLPGGMQSKQEAVFIRAPVITAVEDGVVALAEHNGHPIVVQHGRHLAATFHPELSESDTLHSYFLNLCGEARQTAQAHA